MYCVVSSMHTEMMTNENLRRHANWLPSYQKPLHVLTDLYHSLGELPIKVVKHAP